jgi:hypothetical protein
MFPHKLYLLPWKNENSVYFYSFPSQSNENPLKIREAYFRRVLKLEIFLLSNYAS